MPSISRVQRIFSWLVFIAGLFVSIVGLGELGARSKPGLYEYFTEWIITIAIAVFGFVPLAASLKALRNRRAAGFIYGGGALALVICALWIWLSRIDETVFAVLAVPVAVLFAILSLFWLLTARRNWPPLLPPSPCSWKRVMAMVLVGIVMFLMIVAASIRENLPVWGGDCGPSQPFARPNRPGNAVFIARAVVVRGWPARLMHVEELPFALLKSNSGGCRDGTKRLF